MASRFALGAPLRLTDPPFASAGWTEKEAVAAGHDVEVLAETVRLVTDDDRIFSQIPRRRSGLLEAAAFQGLSWLRNELITRHPSHPRPQPNLFKGGTAPCRSSNPRTLPPEKCCERNGAGPGSDLRADR